MGSRRKSSCPPSSGGGTSSGTSGGGMTSTPASSYQSFDRNPREGYTLSSTTGRRMGHTMRPFYTFNYTGGSGNTTPTQPTQPTQPTAPAQTMTGFSATAPEGYEVTGTNRIRRGHSFRTQYTYGLLNQGGTGSMG